MEHLTPLATDICVVPGVHVVPTVVAYSTPLVIMVHLDYSSSVVTSV